MSLENTDDGKPVHFPSNPTKFTFDREVSAIFPDMAVRSIPNYLAAHAAHSRMLQRWMAPGVRILDVGASRGAFFKQLKSDHAETFASGNWTFDAIDASPDMCQLMKEEFPEINVKLQDLTSHEFLHEPQPFYDVICVNYVLQFLPLEKQIPVMLRLFNMVRRGGVLIWGHKAKHFGLSGDAAHEEYLHFRVSNGYTYEEIAAKTAALKGSMFPTDHQMLMRVLHNHFGEVTETFRFMMFSTVFAVK